MPASPMESASFRARMDKLPGWETMFFTHSVHQKVKHVVPNDLFETNLLTEILVYTMDAADARKKIEDANPASAAKAVATDDELAAMMASSCSKNRELWLRFCVYHRGDPQSQ
jgi:hypothetical protein